MKKSTKRNIKYSKRDSLLSRKVKTFIKMELKIQVHLKLYTEDKNKSSEEYRAYWFDNPTDIVADILSQLKSMDSAYRHD